MLQFLNIACWVLHTLWVLFILFGWIWGRTRLAHLVAVALTALSWLVLGAWYGWGYCPVTDWHWQVRQQLAYPPGHTFPNLLIREVTGIDLPHGMVDVLTGVLGAMAAAISIVLNVRDYWNQRAPTTRPPQPPLP